MVPLCGTNASLFRPASFDNVSAFLSQNNNMLYFLLHALIIRAMIAFYEQVTLLD